MSWSMIGGVKENLHPSTFTQIAAYRLPKGAGRGKNVPPSSRTRRSVGTASVRNTFLASRGFSSPSRCSRGGAARRGSNEPGGAPPETWGKVAATTLPVRAFIINHANHGSEHLGQNGHNDRYHRRD